MTGAPKASTIVQAIELVVHAHRAKLPERALSAAEGLARQEGATRAQLQRAVARGVQASLLIGAVVLAGCQPAKAEAVTPPSDIVSETTVFVMAPGAKIPGGRFMGTTKGVELWDLGDFTVRVRRVQR